MGDNVLRSPGKGVQDEKGWGRGEEILGTLKGWTGRKVPPKVSIIIITHAME